MARSKTNGILATTSSSSIWRRRLLPFVAVVSFLANAWLLWQYNLSLSLFNKYNSQLLQKQQTTLPRCHPATKYSRPWVNSTNLPYYIIEYLNWHQEVRCTLNRQEQNHSVKYLVLQCLHEFGHCGGFADRILPLPLYILAAHKMKRMLLIRWTKPFSLEEFMIPPPFGVDWTIPQWLVGSVPNSTMAGSLTRLKYFAFQSQPQAMDRLFITVQIQAHHPYLFANYNEQTLTHFNDSEYPFHRVYRDIFHSMFRLVTPIERKVQEALKELKLTPGAYTSVHVRLRHPNSGLYALQNGNIDKEGLNFTDETEIAVKKIVNHAFRCASTINYDDNPMFFSSDSHDATNYIVTEGKFLLDNIDEALPRIAGIIRDHEPLHLDENTFNKTRVPSDYYPTFIDLWLLGMSSCTAFGIGGYGILAMSLSYNYSCHVNYNEC